MKLKKIELPSEQAHQVLPFTVYNGFSESMSLRPQGTQSNTYTSMRDFTIGKGAVYVIRLYRDWSYDVNKSITVKKKTVDRDKSRDERYQETHDIKFKLK